MKRMMTGLVMVGFVGLANIASAQVYYPGTAWSTNGTLSPVEKGNIFHQSHVEQGGAYRGAELFGSFSGGFDSKGYDWNRHTTVGVGGRFTQVVKGGMVRAGVAYLSEQRYVVARTTSGLAVFVDMWVGWGQSKSAGSR